MLKIVIWGSKLLVLWLEILFYRISAVWLGWAMVLGSFQCRGVLLHLHIVGQEPAVLAASAGQWAIFFFFHFSSIFHF